MRIRVLLAGVALAFAASGANAAPLLFEDFGSTGGDQLNWGGDALFKPVPLPGNVQGQPSVDLIGVNGSYDFLSGNGHYIDLDGTTGNGNSPTAGQISSVQTFGPGTYLLTFDLAGNQRGAAAKALTVSLGSFSATLPGLSSEIGFTPYSLTITTTTSGVLSFAEAGPSNQQGGLLDNVSLSAAPEPATWSLMIAGVGLAGFALRRRRTAGAALAI